MGGSPLVRTADLRVSVPSGEVLKGISVECARGEILSIIGPAGAGKTTFLRCLNRMSDLDPDVSVSGQVFLDGEPLYGGGIDLPALRRRVGMVFSVPVPLPMSIHENLVF